MKKTILGILILFSIQNSYSQHQHHAKHNMVMLGENEIFISHIVYKVPHNYQVILKVTLDQIALEKYLEAKRSSPDNLMIILLDHMDISKIADMHSISGTIYSEDKQGEREEIISNVVLDKPNFKIMYFDEVPLNLGK